MKRENMKKSKLGLILAICLVAVLAVGGVLLAVLGGGDGQQSTADGPVKLYWNVDRETYWGKSATGFSSREPDADGIFRIKFAVDGQLVDLVVTDKTLVNAIDSLEVMALDLDAEGRVVDVREAKTVLNQTVIKSYVQDASGSVINANSAILMNGMRHRIKVDENTKIYDVSGAAEFVGQEVKAEALGFLDCIHVFENEATGEKFVYIVSHMKDRELYYRTEQMWNFSAEETLRQPDADGVYILGVFHEGEYVELKTKDKDIADLFDYKSPYSPHFAFDFDENGYVISIENSEVGSFGIIAAQRVEVMTIDGNKITAMETMQGAQGRSYTFTLTPDVKIYDASTVAKAEGRHGLPVDSLKKRDIINVWTDAEGNPQFIYISQRIADSVPYWTFKQQYDNTKKETTRKPNSKGYYEFELAVAGEGGTKIYKTKDKNLANQIDATVERVVGLKLNGNIIECVYEPQSLFGYAIIGRGSAVRDINSIFVNLIGFANPNNPTQIMMAEGCKVYDVSGVSKIGLETELQVGDHVYAFRDLSGQVVAIFVTQRSLGGNTLYYNLDYQYDSATGQTKRQPNADGYYEFLMAHKGKQVTVKTKDKAIADKIDGVGNLMMSLVVKNGIVQKVFNGDWAYNQILSSAYNVKKVASDGTLTLAYGENEFTVKPTKNTAIYNVSYDYNEYRGEKTKKFQVGDMLGVIADMYGEPMVIYVRHRMADHMYYRMTAILDEDGDGWYTGQFFCEGEVLTLRTQDKTIVKQINDYAAPMGLALKGDVIRGYIVPTEVKGTPLAGYNSWDVTKVDGKKVTVTYRLPGHEYTGVSEKLTLGKGCKIYDVSPTAEVFGQEITLQPGDRIRGYMNANREHMIIYVTYRANRAAGIQSYCEHCGKEVYWNPWTGGSFKQVDGHYYLNTDVTVQGQAVVGGKDVKPYEIVLDLNGKTITSENARGFLVYYGSTLTVMDSVGTGAIEATGFTGGHGGVGLVSEGTLNLIGGTLRHIPSDHVVTSAGGLMIENSTLNIYGGVIEGGNAQKGELSSGLGGNVYGHNGVINMYDGIIRGGKATSNGGNIYSYNTVFTMYGGSLEGGEAGINGGNLYCANVTKNYFYGGSITGGKTSGNDGNIFILNDQAEVVLGDVTVDGGAYIGQAVITVDGKSVIGKDIATGLTLVYGAKLDIKTLEEGAELYVNASGVISTPTDKAAEIIASGAIKPVANGMIVDQQEGALVIKEQVVLGDCQHCDQQVQWKVWTGSAVSSGHYILTEDMTTSSQVTVGASANVILDLNGKTLTANTRAFVVQGELTVLDSVGTGVIEATGFTGGHGSVGMIDGKLNLYGGTLRMKESDAVVSYGGVIILGAPAAELNMYGGVIENGYAQTGESYKGYGGNIYSYGATINLYGGTIRGGKADIYGGNIFCANASKTNLYGGTIEGGITNGNDGNIYIYNDQASVTLGDVTVDGGIYIGQAAVTVNGKPVIGKESGKGLTLVGGAKLVIQDMKAGTDLYVNASGIFTDPTDKADEIIAAGYIKTLQEDLAVTKDATGALKIGVAEPNCDHCSQYVTWQAWDGTGNLATGHYYLTADVARNTQISIASDNDVVLDLKSFDITCTGSRAFVIAGDLTLMDTVGEGVISATGFTGGHGGVAMVDGHLTMLGGTLKMTASDAVVCKGGVMILGANASLDMRGGVIEGGKAQTGDLGDGMGGNIYALNATIKLTGGTIKGGTASVVGGNIAMEGASCTLSVSGDALIEGGSAQAGGNVSMYSATSMNMAGGTLQNGNAAYINASFGGGGNIFAYGATVNITGGAVKNGTTNIQGGNIAIRNGAALTLSDNAAVEGGTSTYDGGSIHFFNNSTVTMTGGTVSGGLSQRWGGNIYAEGNLTITGGTVTGGKANGSYGGNVYLRDGNFTMTGGTLTAGEARWGGNLNIHETVNGTDYKVVIADDGNEETPAPVISGGKATTAGGNIMAYGALEIQAGTVTGGQVASEGGVFGGNIYLEGAKASLTLTGGTIEGGIAPAGGNIATYLAPITMTGGTVTGGKNNYVSGDYGGGGNFFIFAAPANISGGVISEGDGYQGGNIYARNAEAVITVTGDARIEGGKCTWDGANILLFNWAKLDLQSGTITDGTPGRNAPGVLVDKYAKCNLAGGTVGTVTVANNAAEMNVSGAVVVGNLDLTSGAFVNVGTMANGANVTVTANDGRFSVKNANAVTYAEYFKAAVSGKKVDVVDGALHIVNA